MTQVRKEEVRTRPRVEAKPDKSADVGVVSIEIVKRYPKTLEYLGR